MKIEEKLPAIFQGIDNVAGHVDAPAVLRGAALDQIAAYVEQARAKMASDEQAAVDRMLNSVSDDAKVRAAEQAQAEKAAALEASRQAELHEEAQREADADAADPKAKRK